MIKPNLIVPGAGKSGTSSLHDYLNQHPEIIMDSRKEPQFFSIDSIYKKGFYFYNDGFAHASTTFKYYGESSTTYLASKAAIERMKKNLDDPKFIIILRNPIDRVYSHYTWLCALDMEDKLFREAVISEFNNPYNPNKPYIGKINAYKNYIEHSKYGICVSQYIETFGYDNVLIITTEKLRSQPLHTLNQCFSFLGLQSLESIEEKNENVTLKKKEDQTPIVIKSIKSRIPKRVKNFLNQKLMVNKRLNEIFIVEKDHLPLNISDREWLKNLLIEDIGLLKKITKRNFEEWSDFN